ncbi:MAG: DUF721 domain-containing protein [Nitrospirota bacterium]
MQKVSGILVKLLKQYGLEGKMMEYTLAEKWETIAGSIIAAHSKPSDIRYRKLYIIVDSPVWLQELSFYKEELVNNINNYFGRKVINDVFFKIG